MHGIHDITPPEGGLSPHDLNAKTNALIGYVLMGIGLFTGVFWFVGGVWAMIKKDSAKGSQFEDHYRNLTRTFWWTIALVIIGAVLTVVLIGFAILFFAWVWSIFSLVKGVIKLNANLPYRS